MTLNTIYKTVCGRPSEITQGESVARERARGHYNIWKSGKKEQSAKQTEKKFLVRWKNIWRIWCQRGHKRRDFQGGWIRFMVKCHWNQNKEREKWSLGSAKERSGQSCQETVQWLVGTKATLEWNSDWNNKQLENIILKKNPGNIKLWRSLTTPQNPC